jgi:hypothetical protein
MWNVNAALEHSRGPRLSKTIMSALGVLAAAGRFLMMLDGGLAPPTAPAEEAEVSMPTGGPAWPSTPRLCFHGSGGEILAPRHCP